MNIRDWINNNAGVVTILAVMIMVLALIYIFMSGGNPRQELPESQWFYDMTTKTLFEAGLQEHAPIDTPSGKNQGVKAMVYACSNSDCESGRKIAWLEMYTPKTKKKLMEQRDKGPDGVPDMELVRMLDDDIGVMLARYDQPDKWYKANSPEAGQIRMSIADLCEDDTRIKHCLP